MNPIKKYMNTIERKLRVDKATRQRIMNDLCGDVQARLEAGQNPEALMAELGSPDAVVESFHSAFADRVRPRRSPLRWLLLPLAIVPLAEAVVLQLLTAGFSVPEAGAVGVIGGADGPTAIFVAGMVSTDPTAWGAGGRLALALAAAALFCLLQWPLPARGEKAKVLALGLPLLLSAAALVVWSLFTLQAISGLQAGQMVSAAAQRFVLQGGVLALAALIAAVRRLLRAK